MNYFRIIELELNNRLIQALVANLSTEELTKAYKADLEALNEKEKESYKKKWDRLLSDLKKIEEKKLHGITLGSLAIYMGQLRHFKQKGLCLVDCLWSKLDEILTEEGKTAFLRGDLEDMIKQEILEKYRNPPAHTRYLSYQTACECKEYVTKSIITLHAWFKVI